MKKHKPFRDLRGRFSRIPLGFTAFFSRMEKDGKPDYKCGKWIVVGSGKKGLIQCIKNTECPTMLHTYMFLFDDWTITDERIMDAGERVRLASKIRGNVKGNDPYDDIAKNAAHLLEESVKARF